MENLAQYLKANKIKQRDLAERLDISRAYMSQIAGRKRTPPLKLALRIKDALDGGFPLEGLVKDGGEE